MDIPNNKISANHPTIELEEIDPLQWFVMRDLKRSNAKMPAYKVLDDMGLKIFTPKVWKIVVRHGKRICVEVPFIQDLLFVYDSRKVLDPIVESIETLQYRFLRDGYRTPMTVRDIDMERFIHAVESTDNPHYYTPKEVTADMIGKKVRIIGGPLDGFEGRLQKMQGTHAKRLFVELPGFLSASIEVQPEYIQIVKRGS